MSTTPSTPLRPGRWEHPAVAPSIERNRRAELPVKILYNAAAIAVVAFLYRSVAFSNIAKFLAGYGYNPYYLSLAVYMTWTLFVTNIVFALVSLFTKQHALPPESSALSPRQRQLIGLPAQANGPEKTIPITSPSKSPSTPSTVPKLSPTVPPYLTSPSSAVNNQVNTPLSLGSSTRSYTERTPATPMSPYQQMHSGWTPSSITSSPSAYSPGPRSPELSQSSYLGLSPSPTRPALPPSSISMPKYQPAIRDTQSLTSGEMTSKQTVLPDASVAYQFLEQLGIGEKMQVWTENLRRWLALRVFHQLVKRIDQCDLEFERLGLGHLKIKDPAYSTPAPELHISYNASQRNAMTLADVFNAAPTNPAVQQRFALEKFFSLSRGGHREYVAERIRDLAEGTCLASYHGLSGRRWKDKDWTDELPSDAEIVLHVFCRFMDEQMVAEDPTVHRGQPFTALYFAGPDVELDASESSHPRLRLMSYKPPHVNVAIGKKLWPVQQGRNNLFYAIVLFLYYIKTEHSGYLGHLDLTGPYFDLLSAVIPAY